MTGASGDFSGLVAIVTGGASGIGAATAATLVDRGARVAVLDLDVSAALDQGAPDALLRRPLRRHVGDRCR